MVDDLQKIRDQPVNKVLTDDHQYRYGSVNEDIWQTISRWTRISQQGKRSAAIEQTANDHGIGRILTSDPVPSEGSKDRELFDVQNKYFYNILKLKITGGKAKVIVNQHAIDLDGRSAWSQFVDYYEQKWYCFPKQSALFRKVIFDAFVGTIQRWSQ